VGKIEKSMQKYKKILKNYVNYGKMDIGFIKKSLKECLE